MSDQNVSNQYDKLDILPILTTKLYRPPIDPELEPREELLQRLNRNRLRPLTLISAPAGYGKTTLASMWVEASGWVSAWVSLDEGDNDLRTFAGYLVAALGRAFPEVKFRTQDLLGAPGPLLVSVLARYLMNDLEQIEEPYILALDDLYTIHEQAVFDLLNQLLHHPLPTMHLLLITRRDPPLPIPSLRARRQITEVRARDLRFSVTETTRLLSTMLQRDVDEETATQWTQRTEGWVTALQLAALSLRHRGQTEMLDVAVTENNRYLQEYLLAEVLTALPPEREECLLAMSVVERFCAPLTEVLCQSVGGGNSGIDGEAMIDWLREQNLFLIPLDDQQQWFRFHHLFQNLLQERLRRQLPAENVAALHLRAGRWFDGNGLWDGAIRHFLAAGDMAAAIQCVAQHRHHLMNTERWNLLERWIEWFPDEVAANDPILSITQGHFPASRGRGDIAAIVSLTGRLMASMPDDSPAVMELQGELAYFSAMIALYTGQASTAIAKATEALVLLPPQARHLRSQLTGIQAIGCQMAGELERGVTTIDDARRDSDWPASEQAKLSYSRSLIYFMESDLVMTQRSATECIRLAMNYNLWDTLNQARYLLGIAHYLRNELAMAETTLRAMVEEPALASPDYLAQAVCALVRIYHTQGYLEKADDILRSTTTYLQELDSAFSLETLSAFKVELALDRGDRVLARRLAQATDFDVNRPIWFHYVLQLTPIKLLLAEGMTEGLEQALAALEQMDEQLRQMNRKTFRIDVLALQALAHHALGDWQAARERLYAALMLAQPGGFIRNFVDLGPPMADLLVRFQRRNQAATPEMQRHLERILIAFYSSRAGDAGSFTRTITAEGSSAEPLTARELQILRLLATDLSPDEIAGELVVSTSTVRWHIKNIYAKLDVHGRIGAIHRAGELHLL